ncbi:rod shape-determining protein MreD [Staphylococcus saprophyticus]|mgnify:CR=1 FL=1|uniref:Cell-shape determining protein n=4 Tax=Staphylococcus saprophyticus TaxID=29385 RepID=A0A380HKL1_STASA|nr:MULTISPECIES: rod shape-determining protein MreD [Staphylococcus]EHY92833.1 putative cell-shape determining protein [Staphylococcus saprophyticus subsp. saprophyticus KACC 16562]MBF2751374.1 rod shape-determining protein MreD [Staphylococcus saprophyticus]MBF2779535.1 rod shape-determining protein MreD [Staphylococcus saprophyticus]MBF2780321.1 rod shape-determining protein MreD [Staphylococcus saprophyticus]MBN6094746.1 rod shape-determining protein MreD [Staphylococcus saprophyticus]
MRALYYFLIGIVLFYIDTVIGLVIPMQIGDKDIVFVPHLMLMYLLLICVYRSFGVAMILAAVFGIVTDLYFGSFYGLYLFGFILFVVIMDFFFKTFYRDNTMLFITVWLSTIFLEIYVAIIYSILGLIAFNFIDFIVFRLIPTLILNFILLVILYPIITKFFRKVQMKIDSK